MNERRVKLSAISRLTVDATYVYHWNRMGRKGETCVLEVIGGKNSVRVRFMDGVRTITSANALRDLQSVCRSTQPDLFS